MELSRLCFASLLILGSQVLSAEVPQTELELNTQETPAPIVIEAAAEEPASQDEPAVVEVKSAETPATQVAEDPLQEPDCIEELPEAVATECEPVAPEHEDTSIHIIETQGIVLLNSDEDLLSCEELEGIQGLNVLNVNLPGDIEELEACLEPIYCGKTLGFSQIDELKKAILEYFVRHDRPFLYLFVPPQNVTAGVLQIVVRENKAGEIKVEGPYAERLRRYIHIEPGSALSQGKLTKEVNFLNRHPFRRADLIVSPGKEAHTLDLEFLVEKRNSYLITAGVDNTGIPTIGRNRFYTSFTLGQPIGPLDSVISYQYTTAYNRKRFDAHTLQFTAFLESGNTVSLYGGHSGVHVDLPFPNMKNHGWSNQGSLRYTGFSDTKRLWNRSITLGFDFKNTNNTVEFQELMPLISRTVNLTQLMGGVEFRRSDDKNNLVFEGQIYWSPAKWLPNQTNADFNSLRPGAQNHWVYIDAMCHWTKTLFYGSLFSLKTTFQLSSGNLLPSEQLGIGGYASVRGYDERQLNFDNGLIINAEFRAPSFSVFTKVRNQSIQDGLQFLGFADFGAGWDHNAIPGVISRNYLASVGPGIRYSLGEFFTGRLDWGVKLHHKPEFGGGRNEFHFGVTGNY
jgi:hemolysin activation/secretion protein